MKNKYLVYKKIFLLNFILYLIIAASFYGCTLRLISEYDEKTDIAVVKIHKKVETLLTKIERSIGTDNFLFNNFEKKYDEIRIDLSSLMLRAKARPKNEIQVQQFEKLMKQIKLLEEAHKSNEGIQKEEIPIFRSGFNQSFEAIIKLELAKKRGE